MSGKLPIAISSTGRKLYVRKSGTWQFFDPQPAFGVPVAGDVLVGDPDGGIICWRGTAGSQWCHFTPGAPGTWSYKAAAGVTGPNANGFAFASNAVYAVGGTKVDKFGGTAWAGLTDLPGATANPHIVVTAPGELWVTSSNGLVLYYSNDDGASWSNRFNEMATAIGLTVGFRYAINAWTVGGVLYIAWTSQADGVGRVVRYDGASWSLVGGAGPGSDVQINDLTGIWADSDSAIWVFGRNVVNDRVAFWGGSAWATQYTNGATSSSPLSAAETLVGVSSSLLVAANVNLASDEVYETTDGSSWVIPTMPDSNPITALGSYQGGPTLTGISPGTVRQIGGDAVEISGVFTVGSPYRVYLGTAGSDADTACPSAVPGTGFDCYSDDGLTLRAAMPPVANGELSARLLTVVHPVEGSSSLAITVLEAAHYSAVLSMRRSFPPITAVGPRRLELEPRRILGS
jgi:hypothetical protein